jgi:phosphoenolpyruvate carboxykinase (GTP)
MAMLPFCGYNMADYFGHWLKTGRREDVKLPRIFYVNWFRKGEDGKFLWPGFGENSRVLAWMFRRCEDRAEAVRTPIGLVPPVGNGGIETEGLDISREAVEKLLEVDPQCWLDQLPQIHEHYARFGQRLPQELRDQLEELERGLAPTS